MDYFFLHLLMLTALWLPYNLAQAQSRLPAPLEKYTLAERQLVIFNENSPQPDNSGLRSSTLPEFKIPLDPPKVNLQSRDELLAYYHGSFGMQSKWWADWKNGDLDKCVRGTTSRGYQESVIARSNWWRGMAGRPTALSFKLDAEQSQLGQEGAMMLDAADTFGHNPPPTIKCYTPFGDRGADGNLSPTNWADATVVSSMINDSGASNYNAGHRAATLYIDQRSAGAGTTSTRPDVNG
jgi:hypothetical protein